MVHRHILLQSLPKELTILLLKLTSLSLIVALLEEYSGLILMRPALACFWLAFACYSIIWASLYFHTAFNYIFKVLLKTADSRVLMFSVVGFNNYSFAFLNITWKISLLSFGMPLLLLLSWNIEFYLFLFHLECYTLKLRVQP